MERPFSMYRDYHVKRMERDPEYKQRRREDAVKCMRKVRANYSEERKEEIRAKNRVYALRHYYKKKAEREAAKQAEAEAELMAAGF